MDRRQKIVDWLRDHGNPRAESLLNSLNQMNLDDWEQKHRDDLRKMEGWVNYETATKPLRERARGEFDSYTDNPEWYIAGKAAKLGVNIEDLKKTLGELEEERIWNEGRDRRAKEVNDEFIWNFAPESSKRRYIDDPNATIFGKEGKFNPYSKEGQSDLRDVALGGVGLAGDFIPGWGAIVGPAARTIRNEELIREGSPYAPSLKNAGAEALNDFSTYGAAAWLQNFRKAKRFVQGARKEIPIIGNVLENANVTKNLDATTKQLVKIQSAKNFDETLKAIDKLPESDVKNSLINKLSSFDKLGNKEAEEKFAKELRDMAMDKNLDIWTTIERLPEGWNVMDPSKTNEIWQKNLMESEGKGFLKSGFERAEQARKSTKDLRQIVRSTPKIGKIGQIGRDFVLPTEQAVEQGVAKNLSTLYKAKPENPDRAKIDWYKENYLKDWQLGFVPKGKETDPQVIAYNELVAEGVIKPKGISTAEIFGE